MKLSSLLVRKDLKESYDVAIKLRPVDEHRMMLTVLGHLGLGLKQKLSGLIFLPFWKALK